MLASQKYDNALAKHVTREVRSHTRKSNMATYRGKCPSSSPFPFFSPVVMQLEVTISFSSQNIWNFTVTCIN